MDAWNSFTASTSPQIKKNTVSFPEHFIDEHQQLVNTATDRWMLLMRPVDMWRYVQLNSSVVSQKSAYII